MWSIVTMYYVIVELHFFTSQCAAIVDGMFVFVTRSLQYE